MDGSSSGPVSSETKRIRLSPTLATDSCTPSTSASSVSSEALGHLYQSDDKHFRQLEAPSKASVSGLSQTTLPTNDEIYEQDVPILSNTNQVHVSHYLLKLKFSVDTRTVSGSAILFIEEVIKSTVTNIESSETAATTACDTDSVVTIDKIILDCCSIRVQKVEALNLNPILNEVSSDNANLKELYAAFGAKSGRPLNFEVDKWSLSIWGWGPKEFPLAIRIDYETLSSSPSLQWRPVCGYQFKEEVPVCCYSPGTPVNNRGLFPCQEHPKAMATWQCFVELANNYTAFSSSDKFGVEVKVGSDSEFELRIQETTITYFNCSEVLPMSTFTLIISDFSPSNIIEVRSNRLIKSNLPFVCETQDETMYPVRLIFQSERQFRLNQNSTQNEGEIKRNLTFNEIMVQLSNFVISLLEESTQLLGTLPFPRLDVVIMPDCFPTLGFANPNMIFLSPSVLSGSQNNCLVFSRLAHELSHFWFGLSVGALDWNEEWLSEGFATFIQDVLHRRILQKEMLQNNSDSTHRELQDLDLRPCVMLVTLHQELENNSDHGSEISDRGTSTVKEHLQLLCLPKDEEKYGNNSNSSRLWKNGLDPMKQLVQVHYLKGYFFLRELSDLVGEGRFLEFLKNYVKAFCGKLVNTEIFLDYFKIYFSSSTEVQSSVDLIANNWLRNTQLPEPYKRAALQLIKIPLNKPSAINSDEIKSVTENCFQLFSNDCVNAISEIDNIVSQLLSDRNGSVSKLDTKSSLCSNEKIMVLEKILRCNLPNIDHTNANVDLTPTATHKLREELFYKLDKIINPSIENPEVLHRWCEIVINFKFVKKKSIIEEFLLKHPAMGIFLFGELMISEKRIFQNLARKVYKLSSDVVDPPCKQVLQNMLF